MTCDAGAGLGSVLTDRPKMQQVEQPMAPSKEDQQPAH
jgi:hypothetical protein